MVEMVYILVGAVALSVGISALCSLMEAALYAVPEPYVRSCATLGHRWAETISRFKKEMSKPIAAILVFNTIANTAGAAVAGWAVGEIFVENGSNALVIFSILFTLCILYCSEIIPKTAGVSYCRSVAPLIATPLLLLVKLTTPLIWVSNMLARRVSGRRVGSPAISEAELLSMAQMGTEEGALDRFEGSVITNVVGLDRVLLKEILTPRVVVTRFEECRTVEEVKDEMLDCPFSRVPLFSKDNPDFLSGYVIQRDVYRELLNGKVDTPLKSFARPLKTVPEVMRADSLLLQMFEEREHICAVVDEHGSLAGIVSLEDIIEEIVGLEIVDEFDAVSDLRSFAKVVRLSKRVSKGEPGR